MGTLNSNDFNEEEFPSNIAQFLWYQIADSTCPSRRQLHSGVIAEDYWYIFGGSHNFTPVKDFWRLDLNTSVSKSALSFSLKKWEQILPSSNNSMWPCARFSHICVFIPQQRHILLFGGITEKDELLNDVWLFSLEELEWKQIECKGEIPIPRRGHSAVIHNNRLFVFGGRTTEESLSSEMYCLDLDQFQWTKVLQANSIKLREYHTANLYNDRMWVVGSDSQLCAFHFENNTWEMYNTDLPPLYGHQCTVLEHYLLIYGGSYLGASSLIYLYDLEKHSKVVQVINSEDSTPRYFHVMCWWKHSMFVFGGLGVPYNSTQTQNLNDLCVLSPSQHAYKLWTDHNGFFSMLTLDVLKYMLQFFSARSLAKLGQLNRYFYRISSMDYYWKNLYLKAVKDPNHIPKKHQEPKPEIVDMEVAFKYVRLRGKLDRDQFFWKALYWRVILNAPGAKIPVVEEKKPASNQWRVMEQQYYLPHKEKKDCTIQ